MAIHRLAYIAFFFLALITVFEVWSQVGGQSHLDLMPWYLKFVLGVGAAYACVRAAAASVSSKYAWNASTLRWCAILLVLLIGCGIATYYVHVYGEDDQDDQQDDNTAVNSALLIQPPPVPRIAVQSAGFPHL